MPVDRRARPRYADKAEESRKLSGEDEKGERDERESLDVSERPYQGPSAISAANAWRILEGVRGTQIDDPGARFEKRRVSGEGGGEVSVQVEKKTAEVEPIAFFLSRTRVRRCACIRVYSRTRVSGVQVSPVLVRVCPPKKTERGASVPA